MSLTSAFLQRALWTKRGRDGCAVAVPPEGRAAAAAAPRAHWGREGGADLGAGPSVAPGLISFKIRGVLLVLCIFR